MSIRFACVSKNRDDLEMVTNALFIPALSGVATAHEKIAEAVPEMGHVSLYRHCHPAAKACMREEFTTQDSALCLGRAYHDCLTECIDTAVLKCF